MLESKRFKKNKEDFICEHCGREVEGNGYTNHCPDCLWSKHVDINPGDRSSGCGGMMEPYEATQEKGEWILSNRCVRCGHAKKNKLSSLDNMDAFLEVSRKAAKRQEDNL